MANQKLEVSNEDLAAAANRISFEFDRIQNNLNEDAEDKKQELVKALEEFASVLSREVVQLVVKVAVEKALKEVIPSLPVTRASDRKSS